METVGGQSINVTRWGDSGPRVILVHGSAQGSSVGGDGHFSSQRALADHGWSLVIPDRPGHGRSPTPGRPDDAEADGEWVSELFQDGAHVIGHSFGAAVSLAAAARRPEAVKSLTLIEPAMQLLAIDDARVQAFVGAIMGAHAQANSPADLAVRFSEVVRIPPDIRGGVDVDEMTRMGAGIKALKLPPADQLRGWLGTIREAQIPLLTVSGGWNPAFDAVCERVAEIGGGRFVTVPSPHHFPQLSEVFDEVWGKFARSADQNGSP